MFTGRIHEYIKLDCIQCTDESNNSHDKKDAMKMSTVGKGKNRNKKSGEKLITALWFGCINHIQSQLTPKNKNVFYLCLISSR